MNVDELSALYDMDTRAYLPINSTLRLLGSSDSYFLKSIKNKCRSLGIKCNIESGYIEPESVRTYPTVIDIETYQHGRVNLDEWQDIDCQYHDGMSCVSQAIANILSQYELPGKHIMIIGRGHAVQGLKEVLLANDATVTVCHSKSKNISAISKICDIVVIATPKLDTCIAIDKELIIDIGNTLSHLDVKNYISKIGRLTISILLNRFVKCGGQFARSN